MTTTNTIQSLAEELSAAFVRKERPNGTKFVTLRDEAPQWMTDACRECHKDGSSFGLMLPDDWRYEFIQDAAEALANADDPDEATEQLHDYIYTHEQLQWLGSHLERLGYVDEATRDYGHGDSITDDIARGLRLEQEEVLSQLRSALEAIVDDDNDSEQE